MVTIENSEQLAPLVMRVGDSPWRANQLRAYAKMLDDTNEDTRIMIVECAHNLDVMWGLLDQTQALIVRLEQQKTPK